MPFRSHAESVAAWLEQRLCETPLPRDGHFPAMRISIPNLEEAMRLKVCWTYACSRWINLLGPKFGTLGIG